MHHAWSAVLHSRSKILGQPLEKSLTQSVLLCCKTCFSCSYVLWYYADSTVSKVRREVGVSPLFPISWWKITLFLMIGPYFVISLTAFIIPSTVLFDNLGKVSWLCIYRLYIRSRWRAILSGWWARIRPLCLPEDENAKTRNHGKTQLWYIEEYFCHDEHQVTHWEAIQGQLAFSP